MTTPDVRSMIPEPVAYEPTTEQARLIDDRLSQLGATWYALAKAVGVTASYLGHVKRGRGVITNPETIEKVAKALDMSPDPLYRAADRVPADVLRLLLDHPQLLSAVRKAAKQLHKETQP